MKRSTPLTRKTPLKKRRSKPRKRDPLLGPIRDPGYLEWVRTRTCAVHQHRETMSRFLGLPVLPVICEGRVDPHHHTGGRGLGQKTSDSRVFPLCRRHHDQFHDGRGVFDGWTKEQRRDWQDRMVDLYKPVDHVF